MPTGVKGICAWVILWTSWSACATTLAEGPAPLQAPRVVYPNGLALDREGNLFISDVGTHQVLKLDARRQLTVVAGTGEGGFSGDGGRATEAQLFAPSDLAFDREGNLLIADTFNHRIRRVDAHGVIATIVGDGNNSFSHGPTAASGLSLNNPQGIAVDPDGNLFIADTYHHVVRRVNRDGSASTFAGSTPGLAGDNGPADKAQLNSPQAVAVAPDGSVYISDAVNSRIRRVLPNGVIETVAGSGPGSGTGGAGFAGDGGPVGKAKLFSPADLEFNAVGQLYVSDTGNNRIRLIAHGVIATIAGSGSPGFGGDEARALRASLNTPQKIAVAADGSVYIADRVNHQVRKVDPMGTISTVIAGQKDGRTQPDGIMVDPSVVSGRAEHGNRETR